MANPGLNRFRGDAASFSPGQPPTMHHMQQQQQQQAHMYAQYMYTPPQMVPNYYMNPYMMPNMQYDYSQYQGQYPYPGPQPQPYGAPGYSPSYAPANPYPASRVKVRLSKAAYAQKAADPKANFQPSAATMVAAQQKREKRERQENERNEPQNEGKSEPVDSAGTNGSHIPHADKEGSTTEEQANVPAPVSPPAAKSDSATPTPKPVSTNIHLKFPIAFSCTPADTEDLTARGNERELEQRRLAHFAEKHGAGRVLVSHDHVTIYNHNDDTRTQTRENLGRPAPESRKNGKSGGNWAAVLQTAPKRRPQSQQQPPPNQAQAIQQANNEPAAHQNNSQASQASQQATPTQPPKPAVPTAAPVEPLGSLVLRIMYQHLTAPPFKVRVRGLTNTGNICYMNAVLQVLLYCEPFNRMLKVVETKSAALLGKTETPLLDATLRFFHDMCEPLRRALSPDDFYMRLIAHEKFAHLKWGQQEDAEEFLNLFLDGLSEEFVGCVRRLTAEQVTQTVHQSTDETFRQNVRAAIGIIQKKNDDSEEGWNEVAGKHRAKRTVEVEPLPMALIFGGQFRLVLQVPKSKDAQSITLDPFSCVPLDISDDSINTIEDAFVRFAETEELAYKEVVAKKQTFIDQLPHILLIQLKRFLYQLGEDAGGVEKLKKKVAYSHSLVLPSECLLPMLRKQGMAASRPYRLQAVVYHHGVGAEGGHYTCDVLRRLSLYDHEDELNGKLADAEWIRIDDTQSEVVDRDEVLEGSEDSTKNAYILMYQRA